MSYRTGESIPIAARPQAEPGKLAHKAARTGAACWPMPPVKTNGMEPLEQTGVSTGELRRRVNAFLNRSESAAFLSEFLAGPSRELRIAAAAVARRIVSIKTIWA
jgi:hypothetical protein